MPSARVAVHCFPDSLVFARRLALGLGAPLARVALHFFPDAETRVQVEPGPEHALLVRSLHDPNAKLFELLLAASALHEGGAEGVTLVAPYLPYMRQDVAFAPGEAVSQRVLGGMLGGAFERVVCVEPHLHRTASLGEVFPCETLALSAAPAIANWLRAQGEACWLVGPDEESEPWVRAIGEAAGMPHVVASKCRSGDGAVAVTLPSGARAPCARAVVIDDIASSGATLAAAARALYGAGAQQVDAVVAHAIVAPGADARIRDARIGRFVSCDTIPHPTNGIEVAGLIADALLAETKELDA
ncbi:MAG: ribose-phosphate diphosphokinase [Myxococcota bacterium]